MSSDWRRFPLISIGSAEQAALGEAAAKRSAAERRPAKYSAYKPCDRRDCGHMLQQHDWNTDGTWQCQAPGCSCTDFLTD